jgi:hypothetical protein
MNPRTASAFTSPDATESNLIFNIEPRRHSRKHLLVISSCVLKISRHTGTKVFFVESRLSSDRARPSAAGFLRLETPKTSTRDLECIQIDPTSQNLICSPQRTIEQERKIAQDIILQKCRKLCSKNDKPAAGLQTEAGLPMYSGDIDFSDLEGRAYSELPWIAEESAEYSRKVQAYLHHLPATAIRAIVEVVKNYIGRFVCSCFGCYLPRDLVLVSQEFKELARAYCLMNLHHLLPNKFAGHILRALAEDPVYCRKLLKKCEEKIRSIMLNLQSVLVLATFVKKAPDEDCLAFLVSELESTISLTSDSLILRSLTNLIDRLSGSYLMRVVRVINLHMPWLVDDSLGNFGVQALIRKKVPSTIDRFKHIAYGSSIVTLFVNKHRKFVFLEALRSFGEDREFFMYILKELMMNTSNLRLLFKYEDSAWLFIALLAHLHQDTNNKILKKVSRRITRVAEEIIHSDMFRHWTTIRKHVDLFISHQFSSLIDESPALNQQSSIHSS